LTWTAIYSYLDCESLLSWSCRDRHARMRPESACARLWQARVRGFLDAWRLGGGVNYTARGLAYRWTPPFWGALRDTANAAHLALVHPPALKCHVLMHRSVRAVLRCRMCITLHKGRSTSCGVIEPYCGPLRTG
jgi:hypothetical protein